jgi:hypothetical protein
MALTRQINSDTEIRLSNWRNGQTHAERLCASILVVEGFSAVDPQCPLGGPDGLKDVLCEKSGWKYVGAAFFPTDQQDFKEIKKKFLHDLGGVKKNDADGIVFLTNQKLTPGERDELLREALEQSAKAIVYHLERIRLVLDTPAGFGLRLEFLEIPMTAEDQISFFSSWNTGVVGLLQQQADNIREISQKLDNFRRPVHAEVRRLANLFEATRCTSDELMIDGPIPHGGGTVVDAECPATKLLNANGLCMLHRALMNDSPHPDAIGQFRRVQSWIGPPGSTPKTATYVPPPPDKVPFLTEGMLEWWRNGYEDISEADTPMRIHALTEFHHRFVTIHPFLDGNGRISRFLLNQQAGELLQVRKPIVIEDRQPYYGALQAAHGGELSLLTEILTQAIFGTEEYVG